MSNASRDENNIATLIAASNVDGTTPVKVYADPVTHRLLVDLPTSGGSVTSVSVVSANGFAGTVATATTTPAITLSTTINSPVLAGNGTAISAATTTGTGSTVVLNTAPTFATSITTPSVLATANDSGALGASGTAFADLFLASGGVINWNAGNMTITQSGGVLTVAGGNFVAPQFSPTGATATGNRFYLPATNTLGFSTNGIGRVQIDTAAMSPITNDGFALGSSSLGWSDAFFATGALLDFGNANSVITHSSAVLTVSTGDLRVTTAGTNAASVVTVQGTQALTNKTLNGNTFTTGTYTLTGTAAKVLNFTNSLTLTGTDSTVMTFPTTTATIARTDAAQTFTGTQTFTQVLTTSNAITATGNAATVPITSRINTVTNNSAATLTITLTTTSAIDGQMVVVRVLDFSAAAQTLVWVNTENSTTSVPATTNGSTTLPLTVGFQYNSLTSKWRCLASA